MEAHTDRETGVSKGRAGTGGCVPSEARADPEAQPMGFRLRAARALVGLGFLAAAGALSSRSAPGRIALWPVGLVPAWFGISHLIAAQIGYRGCPEIGAIPSVMLGRRVKTGCGPWERIDGFLE